MKGMQAITVLCLVFLGTCAAYEGQLQWFAGCGGSQYEDAGDNFPGGGAQIVGGVTPRRHEFPYMVSIRQWPGGASNHYCGGALIAPQWVVTAAHCVVGRSVKMTRLVFGEHQRNQKDANAPLRQKVDPALILTYPLYVSGYSEHDIALIKLEQNVSLSEGVQPACAPDPGDSYAGQTAVVSGWGDLHWGSGDMSDLLQWMKTPVQTNAACQQRFGAATRISRGKLCGGRLEETERDACQADSGSPMTVKRDGRFSVIGLVSYGRKCASGYPGVYNRVGEYVDWITYTMDNN